MATTKKVKKKASKKKIAKVSKKKVTKVSSSKNGILSLDEVNTGSLFEGFEGEFEVGMKKMFLDGVCHYQQAKLKAENGEFRGDFTRNTFDPFNTFSKVHMQQGRVQLDADWNEQNSIFAHHLRNLACDVAGEHWGPHKGAGFVLNTVEDINTGMYISPGHYYVNGLLCEVGLDNNGQFIRYTNQPYYPLSDDQKPGFVREAVEKGQEAALIYLDVWERHYNYINDDSIREVALGGTDTATRAKIIWQIKVALIPVKNARWGENGTHPFKENYQLFLNQIGALKKPGTGKLCARVNDKSGDDKDPCLVAPESRYRGAENQLYRVEIHNAGTADANGDERYLPMASFKWSRENSSVIFPVTEINGNTISLEHLGKDCRYGLKPNDWVELIDDDYVLQCRAEPLLQVVSIDEEHRQIKLSRPSGSTVGTDLSKHPYLRRWDQKDGNKDGIVVQENLGGELWFKLENGIQVQFKGSDEATSTDANGNAVEASVIYQTGDYWLIPARTITGDIEWPVVDDQPQAMFSHGVVHHYAPLALISKERSDAGVAASGDDYIDLRRILKQVWE